MQQMQNDSCKQIWGTISFTVNSFLPYLLLTVKIVLFLRLSTKFSAVLRLSVNPIETLLMEAWETGSERRSESNKALCSQGLLSTPFWREFCLTHWKITKEAVSIGGRNVNNLRFADDIDGLE